MSGIISLLYLSDCETYYRFGSFLKTSRITTMSITMPSYSSESNPTLAGDRSLVGLKFLWLYYDGGNANFDLGLVWVLHVVLANYYPSYFPCKVCSSVFWRFGTPICEIGACSSTLFEEFPEQEPYLTQYISQYVNTVYISRYLI